VERHRVIHFFKPDSFKKADSWSAPVRFERMERYSGSPAWAMD
jgi:hypothetical protein